MANTSNDNIYKSAISYFMEKDTTPPLNPQNNMFEAFLLSPPHPHRKVNMNAGNFRQNRRENDFVVKKMCLEPGLFRKIR